MVVVDVSDVVVAVTVVLVRLVVVKVEVVLVDVVEVTDVVDDVIVADVVVVETVVVDFVVVDVTVVVLDVMVVTDVVVVAVAVVVVVMVVGVVVGVVISHAWNPSRILNDWTMFVNAVAVLSQSLLSTNISPNAHPMWTPVSFPSGPANSASTCRMALAVSSHVSKPVLVSSGHPIWYSHFTMSRIWL